MNDFIRIEEKNVIFYVNRNNIAGLSISPNKPTDLCISMCGDTEPWLFTFSTTEERNNKLSEILADKGLCDRETTEPQVSEE